MNGIHQQKMGFGMSTWQGLGGLKKYGHVKTDALAKIDKYVEEEAPKDGHNVVLSNPRFHLLDSFIKASQRGQSLFFIRENPKAINALREQMEVSAKRPGWFKPSVTVNGEYNPKDPASAFKSMAAEASAKLEEQEKRSKLFRNA